jgi:thiopurine S-methyltransferase
MDDSFWHGLWDANNIKFHQSRPNPHLIQFGSRFPPGKVFVPLCGKSGDMYWLEEQGHEVIGVELSELAGRAFFDERQRVYTESREGKFLKLQSGPITLWIGDFFNLTPDLFRGVTGVYDRAALIALPLELRERYVRRMRSLLGANPYWMLLLAIEYAAHEMEGPPFAVTDEEVRSLYRGAQIESLAVLENVPHQWDSVTALTERVYGVSNGKL